MSYLAVRPDGRWQYVAASYQGIKDGLDGATFDHVTVAEDVGIFCDDEGMMSGIDLNVPAALFIGIVLYGPVVLVGGVDGNGDTQPPPERAVTMLVALADRWREVVEDGISKGQDVTVRADAATIPPPEVIAMTDEEFQGFLNGTWRPGRA